MTRSLSCGPITCDLSKCGGVARIPGINGVPTQEELDASGFTEEEGDTSHNTSCISSNFMTTRYAVLQKGLRKAPIEGGHFNKSLKRKQFDKYEHKAFPFGTSKYPFKSSRGGGSTLNATTKTWALRTKTPMGPAGIVEMFHGANFTHKGTYAADRFGSVNFADIDDGAHSSSGGVGKEKKN